MYKPTIYISHAWGGESEEITQKIMEKFSKEGIEITLDKNDLGYRQSINEFMLSLGAADAIIIVVSNKYLHSEYCMFELLQIYKNKNILDRIFPVVLDEVQIAKSTDRLDLVKYWETQTNELENKIRELDSISNIEGITDDLNLYKSIRNNIAHLTAILKDINTLNITLHKDSDFDSLFKAVSRKVDQNRDEALADAIETVSGTDHEVASIDSRQKVSAPIANHGMDSRPNTIKDIETTSGAKKKWLPWVVILLGLLVGFFGVTKLSSSKSNPDSSDKSELSLNYEDEKPNDQPLKLEEEKTTQKQPAAQITITEPTKRESNPVNPENILSKENEEELKEGPKINTAPNIGSVKTMPVRIFLDRAVAKAKILINGKPISDYKGNKTLNTIEAELPLGNQEFTIMKRNDTCKVYRIIREGEDEVTLSCN